MARRRVLSYEAASEARSPIVVDFGDGRWFEFPSDMDADSWLGFIEAYGDLLDADDDIMPVKVVIPFYRMVLGEERLNEVRKHVNSRELQTMATDLWQMYNGSDDKADEREWEGADQRPPSSTS